MNKEPISSLKNKLDFILEIEKLKAVLRKTRPHGQKRFENSAEHSWQTALAAVLFMPDHLDGFKVLKMLLIHDVVEIDTGDVFVYDDQERQDIVEAESKAAERIFGILDDPLSSELLSLWQEFEDRASPEAVYAKALDRLCPVVQNLNAETSSWNEHGISRERVIEKNSEIAKVDEDLWTILKGRIDGASFSTQ